MKILSSRRQFVQIGPWDWSSRWRYFLKGGWWPDRRRAGRTSSFLLFICFASWEANALISSTRLCFGRSLWIVSFITSIELEKETGRIVSVAIVMASLAALLGRTLPEMAEWPGIHWMMMKDEMKLMELWIEEVWGFDKMRASHKDLLLLLFLFFFYNDDIQNIDN